MARTADGNRTISIGPLWAFLVLKAFLISLATLITFDAVAWQGTVRTETVRQLGIAAQVVGDLDWTWG